MKKTVLAILLASVVIMGTMLAVSCTSITQIGDIKSNPSQFEGKEVTVKGSVTNDFWFALLSKGAYEVTDTSGSIWVVTGQTPPEKNALIEVKGKVESAVTVGDRSLGVVIAEETRKNL